MPKQFFINNESVVIKTKPHTDLWQKTYYHFIKDNAPILQMKTREKYFSFVVKHHLIVIIDLINVVLQCI